MGTTNEFVYFNLEHDTCQCLCIRLILKRVCCMREIERQTIIVILMQKVAITCALHSSPSLDHPDAVVCFHYCWKLMSKTMTLCLCTRRSMMWSKEIVYKTVNSALESTLLVSLGYVYFVQTIQWLNNPSLPVELSLLQHCVQ